MSDNNYPPTPFSIQQTYGGEDFNPYNQSKPFITKIGEVSTDLTKNELVEAINLLTDAINELCKNINRK